MRQTNSEIALALLAARRGQKPTLGHVAMEAFDVGAEVHAMSAMRLDIFRLRSEDSVFGF